VELHPVRRGYGWTHLEVTERWNGETARFNARQVSDGLLRLIAVAAMHELPISPSVLLLDEVENGLHPQLLGGFVRMLQDLVRSKRGQTQIVLATHSPITVNFCESPDDVILVTRGKGGTPRARRSRRPAASRSSALTSTSASSGTTSGKGICSGDVQGPAGGRRPL
jgi:predicted ATPase